MKRKSLRHGRTEFVCHIIAVLLVCVGMMCAASGFLFEWLHPEYVSSFPSWLYLLRIVPFVIAAVIVEIILLLTKWWHGRSVSDK